MTNADDDTERPDDLPADAPNGAGADDLDLSKVVGGGLGEVVIPPSGTFTYTPSDHLA